MALRTKYAQAPLPLLTAAFLLLEPLLDVAAFWKAELGLPDLLLTVLRFLLFSGLVVTGYLNSRRRRVYWLLAAGTALYLAGHFLAVGGLGALDLPADLTDQLRILMLPATTLALMSLLRADRRVFPALGAALAGVLGLILLVVGLSALTGTEPHTYLGKQMGVLGWFLWPNSQSAILSMVTPLVIAWSCERFPGRLLPPALCALGGFGLLFLLGTRLAFVSIPLIGVGLALCLARAARSARRPALTVLLAALLFTALYPVSPMRDAQRRTAENQRIKQQRIDAAVAAWGVDPAAGRTDDLGALAAAYRYNLQGMVDRFGIRRVAEAYEGSLDQGVIFDDRRKKLTFNGLLMEDSGGLSRWFGLEITRMTQTTQVYDFYADDWTRDVEIFAAENDLWGVYYSGGLVLLGGVLAGMLWIGLRALLALVRRGREVFSGLYAAHCCAYCFFVIYAIMTNSVLRQTRSTLFVAAVLAGLWYLSGPRPAPGGEGENP